MPEGAPDAPCSESYTGRMSSFRPFSRLLYPCLLALFGSIALPQLAHAWGGDGHRLINAVWPHTIYRRKFLRFSALKQRLMKSNTSVLSRIRWRSPAEPELNAAQAPEHFIDFELADALGPLPRNRLDFEAKVFAAGQRPEKIGLQPWVTNEVWERLKAALREYRTLSAAGQNTHAVEQAAIFYAGWLGHYVGDGSQPLHTTVQYNGWVGPNPNGYTTAHTIHGQFETGFVSANLAALPVQAKITAPHAIDGDLFGAYVAYLRQTATYVEQSLQAGKGRRFYRGRFRRIARLHCRTAGCGGQHAAGYDSDRLGGKREACT